MIRLLAAWALSVVLVFGAAPLSSRAQSPGFDHERARHATPQALGFDPFVGHVRPLGSAIVVGDHLAVTALHVVGDLNTLQLSFLGGVTIPAQVVVRETGTDVAILRASQRLPATPFLPGDTEVVVGATQHIIGYRYDLPSPPSVKTGQVVGFLLPGVTGPDGRHWPLIESDTPASFGDSGGAAIDSSGRLMGMVRGGLAAHGSGPTVVVTPAGLIGAYLRRGWILPPGFPWGRDGIGRARVSWQ